MNVRGRAMVAYLCLLARSIFLLPTSVANKAPVACAALFALAHVILCLLFTVWHCKKC